MKVYIGMGLTHAPEAFRGPFRLELRRQLADISGVELLDFVGLEAGTEVDVYRHDRECVEMADQCIFIVTHQSTGLGMEIMLRQMIGRPMLVFAEKDARITRMLTGMCACHHIKLHRYGAVSDIVDVVRQEFVPA